MSSWPPTGSAGWIDAVRNRINNDFLMTLRVAGWALVTSVLRGHLVWVFLVAVVILAAVVSPVFFQAKNIFNILRQASALGILAVGTAWGEWSPVDFSKLEMRAQIAAASGGQALPEAVPSGLQRLSSFWTAPFPAYAPAFVKSPHLGYLLSAMFGVGLFGVVSLIAGAFAKKLSRRELDS